MTAVADPYMALIMFLRSAVGGLVAQTVFPNGLQAPAIFRPDLPKWFDDSMPTGAMVLRPAGGYTRFGATMFYVGDPRVDIVCYGETQEEATGIAQASIVVLKQLVSQMWENTLLYSASISGGPIPLPDTQTIWPAVWMSTTLMVGELPIAA